MRVLFFLWIAGSLAGAALNPIEVIRAVELEGKGNVEAAAAFEKLVAGDGSQLVAILSGMGGANPVAANWLRSAVEAIADRAEGKLPVAELGDFLLDRRNDPRARRLAFELVKGVEAEVAAALVPGMLSDPSPELRRDAVGELISAAGELAEAENTLGATLVYRQALGAALAIDQVKLISKELRGLGQVVDLPEHFGFLMRWRVIAPFDNTDRAGFDRVFPPEEGIDLAETYEGKTGPVSWRPLETSDQFGMVDLNKPFGMLKEVVGYAYTGFQSEEARSVELRLGCKNAWKVWVNGELIFGRDEYHRGMRIDQYRMPVELKAGKNTILIKLCQNEQTEEWTVQWQFQMRVCDASGMAVLAENRLETPKPPSGRRGRRPNGKSNKQEVSK